MLDEDSRFFLPEPIDIDDDREGRKPLRSTYPTLPERYPAQPPGYYWIPHFDVPAPRNMRLLREVPSVDYARLAAGDFDYAIEVLEDYPILDLDHYGILRVLQPFAVDFYTVNVFRSVGEDRLRSLFDLVSPFLVPLLFSALYSLLTPSFSFRSTFERFSHPTTTFPTAFGSSSTRFMVSCSGFASISQALPSSRGRGVSGNLLGLPSALAPTPSLSNCSFEGCPTSQRQLARPVSRRRKRQVSVFSRFFFHL